MPNKESASDKPKNLLSRKEVAEQLGVHSETIRRWTEVGRLKCAYLGLQAIRYRQSEVDRFIASCEV